MESLLSNMEDTLRSESVYTKQQRIAQLARNKPDMRMLTLAHHIDVDWLREAYRRIRKDGATGVDGVTAKHYEQELKSNLTGLLNRFKSGSYVAPPVKRVYIPKGDKEVRSIGIPTLEDKILQKAVVMVLEPVYEQEFLDCTHGYRPGRSVHKAIAQFRASIMEMTGGWIYEVDIRKFFDSVNHRHMREILSKRVGDGVIRRVVSKWLHAGVMEKGLVSYPEAGTPQGGVISPLLSNIYLHEVLDKWFDREIKPRLNGKANMCRFADDFVIILQRSDDANRLAAAMPKRMGRFDLTVHETKTRLIDFQRPQTWRGRTDTFDFLGFTWYWAKSRKETWVVKWSTSSKKLRGSIRAVYEKCKHNRHEPIEKQQEMLNDSLRGHYSFYGVTCNHSNLQKFYEAAKRCWQKWLNRRDRDNHMPWEKFKLLVQRYPLERPRIVHSFA
jgi:group II intron reverse transcriptase/maturase